MKPEPLQLDSLKKAGYGEIFCEKVSEPSMIGRQILK